MTDEKMLELLDEASPHIRAIAEIVARETHKTADEVESMYRSDIAMTLGDDSFEEYRAAWNFAITKYHKSYLAWRTAQLEAQEQEEVEA